MEKKILNATEPKPAATVILSRRHKKEFQIYLIRRSSRSRFMAGRYVFPGGMIDSEDREIDVWKARADMDLVSLSQRLGGPLSLEEALANGVCAIRETFEEAGVLLARKNEKAKGHPETIFRLRSAGHLTKGWLLKHVLSEDWILEFSRLFRWSHWITPKALEHRFDTRFFLAFMPEDQECAPDAKEATHGIWITPEEGLTGNMSGDIPLSPPTLVELQRLSPYRNLDELLMEGETRPWGEPQRPKQVFTPEGPVILQIWDPARHQEGSIHARDMESKILPVGEPFSRMWFHQGVWKPVRV